MRMRKLASKTCGIKNKSSVKVKVHNFASILQKGSAHINNLTAHLKKILNDQ